MILNHENFPPFTRPIVLFAILNSLIFHPVVSGNFECPKFWNRYEDRDFCYLVLSSLWPETYENALQHCQSYTNENQLGGLLEVDGTWDLSKLLLPTDMNYYVSARKFQGHYYNLYSKSTVPLNLIEPGHGNCVILNHYKDGNADHKYMLYPTDCKPYKRPFICALYPNNVLHGLSDLSDEEAKSVSFERRSLDNLCAHTTDFYDNCDSRSYRECAKSPKGCERTCCEVMSYECESAVDILASDKCELKKQQGFCKYIMDICTATCCGEMEVDSIMLSTPPPYITTTTQSGVMHTENPCGSLDDAEGYSAKECFDRAFHHDECNSDYTQDDCALSCCASVLSITEELESEFEDEDFLLKRGGKRNGEGSTTTYSACLELTNKRSMEYCTNGLLDDEFACDSRQFERQCAYSCCVSNPGDCIHMSDVRSEKYCYRVVLTDRCAVPRFREQCQSSCCEYVGGSVSTSTTTMTSTTTTPFTETVTETMITTPTVTEPGSGGSASGSSSTEDSEGSSSTEAATTTTTTVESRSGGPMDGLCEEFEDNENANCSRRVSRGNCEAVLTDERRCQYSCCLDLFLTTTTQMPTTTEAMNSTVQSTTENVAADAGLDECIGLQDDNNYGPGFCAAVVAGMTCDLWEHQHLCQFSCCMNDYAHDYDDQEEPDVETVHCCDDLEDSLTCGQCLEVFVLGRCNEVAGCEKTCCLWETAFDGSFDGNECLKMNDDYGYEYCHINCHCEDDDDTMCPFLCQRTMCLKCHNPYDWPASTHEPNECLDYTNEMSNVYCAEKVFRHNCDVYYNNMDGFFDAECNFACCAEFWDSLYRKKAGELPVNGSTDVSDTEAPPMVAQLTSVSSGNGSETANQDSDELNRTTREADMNGNKKVSCFDPVTGQVDTECSRKRRSANNYIVADSEFQIQPPMYLIASVAIIKFVLNLYA